MPQIDQIQQMISHQCKVQWDIDLTVHFAADKGSNRFLGAIYSMLGHLFPKRKFFFAMTFLERRSVSFFTELL